jgi:hypothetical protein
MAKALILALIALMLMSAKGCQTIEARASTAAVTQGQTQARETFPDLPTACTAHTDRVIPKLGEKVRWTQERWEIVADNRDNLADDCAAWGKDMKAQRNAK